MFFGGDSRKRFVNASNLEAIMMSQIVPQLEDSDTATLTEFENFCTWRLNKNDDHAKMS